MTGRFWLPDGEPVPWFWTFPNASEYADSRFPCERGRAGRCASCHMHWNGHFETLGFPKFNLHRPTYSLADLALLRPGRRTKIVFHGDSTLLEMYELALCHAARTPGVTYLPDSNKRVKFGTQAFKVTYSKSISHIEQKEFAVRDPRDGSNTTRLNLFYARSDHVMSRRDVLHALCAEADVLVVNWGVHYDMAAARSRDEYASEVEAGLGAMEACATQNQTTLVKLAHASQNFVESDYGWFTWGSKSCGPIRGSIQDADRWTELLRGRVLPRLASWLELVPTPWADESEAMCPLPASKRALHWVPYFDVSAGWWDFHKARVSHIVDCTHRMMVPEWGPPLWDALFLARLKDQSSAADCRQARLPPSLLREGPNASIDKHHAEKFRRVVFEANFVDAKHDLFSALQTLAAAN
jgi:hypothetical protein